ncbi:hypothetical protein [Asticcacaulis sp.]|uniref:hypothetical protein n=1 Tax=Asticcacaulis sp. TaxID=1872648 RepID=UPI003F7CCC65
MTIAAPLVAWHLENGHRKLAASLLNSGESLEVNMPKILEEWTVMPHGRLTRVDDGIWTVTGELHMPLTPLERRMTVVRLKSGGMVIYSAIALDEPQMEELEESGRPAYLVIPGDRHRIDARIWKKRYPDLKVIAPAGAEKAAEEATEINATEVDFGDEDVRFVTVKGMSGHEAALIVRRSGGTTLIVNDVIGNMPQDSGFVLRLTGFAGHEPHIPVPVKMGLKDKDDLRSQLLAWATEPDLRRIIMSHGDPIESDVSAQLRALADTLN